MQTLRSGQDGLIQPRYAIHSIHVTDIRRPCSLLPTSISLSYASAAATTLQASHTELNVFTIDGNTEPDRQKPMWARGRIDHFGLQAASTNSFEIIRKRLIDIYQLGSGAENK